MNAKTVCPECGYDTVIKKGCFPTRKRDLQRYLCKNCARSFSIPMKEIIR